MFSLSSLRQLAIRGSKLRTPLSSLFYKREQHVSGSFETSESPADQTFERRKRFPRRKTVATSSAHRSERLEVTQPPQSVDIKHIFSEDNSAGDGELNKGDSEPEIASPPHLAHSEALSAFHLKLKHSQHGGFQYSPEDWKNFELEACTENPDLQKSWETLCMQLMYQHGCPDLATSLLDYLSTETSSPKISTLSLYIALQGEYGGNNKEQAILETFKKVLEISDVFDAITAKYLILGLTMTTEWRSTLDILEMAKLTSTPGRSYYSPIIVAALRENDVEMAFQLLDELALRGYEPQDKVLVHILQECQRTGSHDLLERYLTRVWKYNWLLSRAMAKEVELYFTGCVFFKYFNL